MEKEQVIERLRSLRGRLYSIYSEDYNARFRIEQLAAEINQLIDEISAS